MTRRKGKDTHQADLWEEHRKAIFDKIVASYGTEKGDPRQARCTISYVARETKLSRRVVRQHATRMIWGGQVRRTPDGALRPAFNPVIGPLMDNLDERFMRDCPTCAKDMETYRAGTLKSFPDYDSLLRSFREKGEGDLSRREGLFRDFYLLYRAYLWARHLDGHTKKPGFAREYYVDDFKYYLIGKLTAVKDIAESALDEKEKSRPANAGQSSP